MHCITEISSLSCDSMGSCRPGNDGAGPVFATVECRLVRVTESSHHFTAAQGPCACHYGTATQRFAEKKTGRPFAQLAQALVFDPANMQRTAYTERPWMDGHIAEPNNPDGTWLASQVATSFVAADLVYATPTQYASFSCRYQAKALIERIFPSSVWFVGNADREKPR
jgi:hypothetical protein